MDMQDMATLAGITSTTIFAGSNIPMVLKALRTRDVHSYSLTNLALGNLGNTIHWLYVLNLPFGPIWFLHTFYTIANAIMLLAYLRYGRSKSTEAKNRQSRTGSQFYLVFKTQDVDKLVHRTC